MIKPTKQNQKEWIKRYLDVSRYYETGFYPEEFHIFLIFDAWNRGNSLAEIWDGGTHTGDGLVWMLKRMEPTSKELKVIEKAIKSFSGHSTYKYMDSWGEWRYRHTYIRMGDYNRWENVRRHFFNPWVMSNWKKGVVRKRLAPRRRRD